MHEDIPGRNDLRSTVRNDVGEAEKLDTTVDGPMTDKRNAAPFRIKQCTPESIFRKEIKNIDLSSRVNFANSSGVEDPELVLLRDPTIQTDNELGRRSGGIATKIANPDGIWRPEPSDFGTAATHDEIKNISKKLEYREHNKNLDFEASKLLKRENIERENIKEIMTRISMN